LDRLNSLEPDSLEPACIEHIHFHPNMIHSNMVHMDMAQGSIAPEMNSYIFLSDISLTQTLGRTEKRSPLLERPPSQKAH